MLALCKHYQIAHKKIYGILLQSYVYPKVHVFNELSKLF